MTDTAMSAAASRALVLDFLGAWPERDLDRIMSFFAADAVYHNVPVAPIVGLPGIREIFRAFLDTFEHISLDIVRVAAEPGLVFAERIDRFSIDGRRFELPVNGVFELSHGKIVRFSDYFDLATFERGSGMKL